MADLNTNTTELQTLKTMLENRIVSDVLAGTYTKVTVSAYGHVTEGSNPTTLSEYGITDAVPATRTINGKELTSDITLSAADVSALPGDTNLNFLPLAGGTVTGKLYCDSGLVLRNMGAIVPTLGVTGNTTIEGGDLTCTATPDGNGGSKGGEITAQSFVALSDARLKQNFETFTPRASILELPIYKFDFINGETGQIGCKAQDLQELCPELVVTKEDGYLAIKESKLVYLLLDEVKKLNESFQKLKEENELLKQQVIH